jgi:hypothetical protein
MPLTLRTANDIMASLIPTVMSGDLVTDFSKASSVRMLLWGVAAELAQNQFSLFELSESWFIDTATGEDLARRMRSEGLEPDTGQPASDPVRFVRVPTWLDDIPLPSPQTLFATLADGTRILYRSLGDGVLQARGRSISGLAPATSVIGGANDQLALTLDGDGPQTYVLGTQTTLATIANALQVAVRARAALAPAHQPAYAGFVCDLTTTPGALTLRSGTAGPSSTAIVTPATTHDASVRLKLGAAQGGTETPGEDSLDVPVLCERLGTIGNVGAGQLTGQTTPKAGVQAVYNPFAFVNGREPAPDGTNRENLKRYLQGLGEVTRMGILQAVYNTVGLDGQRHVLTAQVLDAPSHVTVYVCDGRSLTVGAQPDVVEAVRGELLGTGSRLGGWIAAGATVAVLPALVRALPVDVRVVIDALTDPVLAKQALTSALSTLLMQWPLGQSLGYVHATTAMHRIVPGIQNVAFTLPGEFATSPLQPVVGVSGEKLMPGPLVVEVGYA